MASVGPDIDLVIAEGFKASSVPKVVVSGGPPPPPSLDNVIVGDVSMQWDIPTYTFDTVHPLGEQVRDLFLKPPRQGASVSLVVDVEHNPTSRYPTRALMGIVKDFVSRIKGIPSHQSNIRIHINVTSDSFY